MPKLDLDVLKATLEQTDEDRVYFRVDKFDIRVVRTDEGVVVDIYPWDEVGTYAGGAIASTYCFDTEADEAMGVDPDA